MLNNRSMNQTSAFQNLKIDFKRFILVIHLQCKMNTDVFKEQNSFINQNYKQFFKWRDKDKNKWRNHMIVYLKNNKVYQNWMIILRAALIIARTS